MSGGAVRHSIVIENARVVLADAVVDGWVAIAASASPRSAAAGRRSAASISAATCSCPG